MTSPDEPSTIDPDTKDWTWVLDEPCPDCGYDAAVVEVGSLGARVRANAELWRVALRAPGPARRIDPHAWSVLEYACHVRDVHTVFARRVRQLLEEDDPLFANWDQDESARLGEYGRQDPADVLASLLEGAARVATSYDAVPADSPDWQRPGRRDNGSVFTLASLGRYHLHDLVHHGWDVRDAVTAGGAVGDP